MLQLYDINKNKIEGLTEYKDLNIESTLSTGDKVLSFLYPTKFCKNIVEEGYIQTKTDEFVIKEKNNSGIWTTIKAVLNVEALEGNVFETFDSTEQTIENCLNLALAGTGWTVQVNGVTKKRTVRKTNSSTWDIIQQARKTYRVEIQFDTINKIVKVYEKIGSDKGVYFTEELNLKSLNIQSDSYDFFTRMIAKGKDDLKVTVENYQYSNKVKTLIWKDERYTDINSLREDAILKLDELSKPYRAYQADVIDLAKLNDKYKDILDYSLGDTITLISKDNGIKEKQRIVKITEYPDEPERNTVEIANTTLTFEDVQKEFQDTSEVVNNITADDGTISEAALRVPVERLTINKVDVQELNAVTARIGTLEATKANITDLAAINATINNLQANKANITDLTATNIKFNVGSGGTLDLQTLLSKFVTGENGQFLNLTTDNVTISNAVIKDIIAKNISVEDLKAGTINTNNINLVSADGGLSIVGPTMQFKDKNNKVRLQLGQDTEGDFNFILRAADGTTTLIDGYGIKENAIADKLIKSNMVADGAIGEQQINYSSLITGLNKDTNTSLIKASKVALDLTGQTLEVSFNSLKSVADDTKSKTESNTTSINAINGQIATLIIDTTIEEDGATVKLKDSYSNLKQTVSGINATIASHSTSISNLTNNLNAVSREVTTVENKVATIETSLNSITSRVSSTENSITTINGNISSLQTRMSTAEQKITDSAIVSTVRSSTSYQNDLNAKASKTDVSSLTTRVNSVEQSITATALTTTISSALNGSNSITTTKFTMNKDGLTIKNGGIKIQNNAGSNVLVGDSSGNLSLQNKLSVGGTSSGIINVLNSSGSIIGSWGKDGLLIKSGGFKITNGTITSPSDGKWGETYPEGSVYGVYGNADKFTFIYDGQSGSQIYKNSAEYGVGLISLISDNRQNMDQTYFKTDIRASGVETHKVTTKGDYNREHLRFNTDRPWLFKERGWDVNSILVLKPTLNDKTFMITDSTESKGVSFKTTDTRIIVTVDGYLKQERLQGTLNDNRFYVGSGSTRIDTTSGAMRLYTSDVGVSDSGIYIGTDGAVQIKASGVNRHIFNSNGNKTGGSMEIEGIVYGMSPVDSPRALIEYIEFDIEINGEKIIYLDHIYKQMIEQYAVFPSNPNIEVIEKTSEYFRVRGNGVSDFNIKGQRKDEEAQRYFKLMGGFEHGSEEKVSL